MATVERSTDREWATYSVSHQRFMNLDFIGHFDESEYLTKEAEEIPATGLFTHEECSRWIIHQDDRSDFRIINCKSPLYLVDFELQVYKKQRQEKLKKEQIQYQQEQEQNIRSQNARAGIVSEKRKYFNDMHSWKQKTESVNKNGGNFSEVLAQRPKMSSYSLVYTDFSQEEKATLNSRYGITVAD